MCSQLILNLPLTVNTNLVQRLAKERKRKRRRKRSEEARVIYLVVQVRRLAAESCRVMTLSKTIQFDYELFPIALYSQF